MSDFNSFRHLEPVYALAIERKDYRRGAWLAIRALRTLPSEFEQRTWTLRLNGCMERRRGSPLA